MLTLKLTLSKVTLNEPRIYAKSSGAVLAPTAAILYIAVADYALGIQYVGSSSSSIRDSTQAVSAMDASTSGLIAGLKCFGQEPGSISSSPITTSSTCVEGEVAA